MSISSGLKHAINKILISRKQVLTHEQFIPSADRLIATLNEYGLNPVTVFDIGVAEGTPWLYKGFPDAKFHLVDPTRESLPHMKRWQATINAEAHSFALGSEDGRLSIQLRDTIKHASLMIDVTAPLIQESYQVPVCRFDKYFSDYAYPAFCKIDVEGAEMLVLEGMGSRISGFTAIVIETSLNSLYQDGPEFAEIIKFMHQNGMSFYDFIGLSRRPRDQALHQVDAVFVPHGSPLRVKAWN